MGQLITTHGLVVLAEPDDFCIFGESTAHGEPSDGLHGQSEQVSADGRVLGLWIRLPLFDQLLDELRTRERKDYKWNKPRNTAAVR